MSQQSGEPATPRAADPRGSWRAVIDIGTNSVLLLIARWHGDDLEIALDQATITRLGKGVAASGVLAPESIARTLAVLKQYRETAERHGATPLAVTTEGVRLASNRDDFLTPAAAVLGAPVRLLSGAEEAELSYRSVAQELGPTTALRVLDIGGGSTELAVGEGERLISSVSHPIGAVRLFERFVTQDPPAPSEVAQIEKTALETLQRGQPLDPEPVLTGLAGTVTTAAAMLLGLTQYDREQVDGSTFTIDQVRDLRDRAARVTVAERCQIWPTLEPARADVIVAGMTILLAAMQHCGATSLAVRDRGLRYALIERE
ncbi:Ppx/GppA phosphatase family protein [Nannocystis bainbridge]|uniref:Ppx/GppA family phosphatase n=1 Tax=Nannocystis bainbridge TaxID=2995303 RepID=A0ABT5DYX1_9BACT|nr:Ppx/GppA family phosphatase [Nannocystis bainbridge]MDC0718810.1 Ppx/GppA family phosphatase [Nannocystis bainbridge]